LTKPSPTTDSSGVTHASVFTIWLHLIVTLIILVSLAFFSREHDTLFTVASELTWHSELQSWTFKANGVSSPSLQQDFGPERKCNIK